MKLNKLLSYGYFPKELPPPFNSKDFGKKSSYLVKKWDKLLDEKKVKKPSESRNEAKRRFNKDYVQKYGSSKLIEYSIAKGIFSRRKLGVPNPKQFLDLSQSISDNWENIKPIFELSEYSESLPVEYKAKRTVRTKSKTWNNFKFKLIEESFDKKFQLKLDILNFYPSIYTHSIPWSVLGKEDAKKYFKIKNNRKHYFESILSSDPKAKLYKLSDQIDTLVRNCNERQSVGIPIGPDTSFILAELIACRIDSEIKKKLENIDHRASRYYDDYYFYFNNIGDAETSLKIIQKIIYDFQLETNENKVEINPLPFRNIDDWSNSISSFKFDEADKFELRNYFSLIYSQISKNKKNSSWIVSYSLLRFEYGNVKIKKKNWDIFLNFLLQTILVDPSSIDQIFKILLSYKIYIKGKAKEKINSVLEKVIKEHTLLNHSFEVAWSLWYYKTFKIKCDRDTLSIVLNSNDNISKLICLDLINSGLYKGRKPALTNLIKSINGNSLFDDQWLLAYESFRKNWLNFKSKNILRDNEFFKFLDYYNISFYDPDEQIKISFRILESRPRISDFDIDEEEDIFGWLIDEEESEDDSDQEGKTKY
ncbi:RNA-directed DNA polymerase [Salinimicrobium tongyeongense]|uniref:RNA-directed DNA polymerase n=1 Tax=Salinimicrobium tongyeongense TaxID=2809707 RepID=A0ABY6NPR2_9FLAO|nr:RNA-directed DNA polymerase [Salinimicrobium tongyeongense]UZH54867.1 RNA-directed DNA polymerase [Salinimicrobium tongyeongense]